MLFYTIYIYTVEKGRRSNLGSRYTSQLILVVTVIRTHVFFFFFSSKFSLFQQQIFDFFFKKLFSEKLYQKAFPRINFVRRKPEIFFFEKKNYSVKD